MFFLFLNSAVKFIHNQFHVLNNVSKKKLVKKKEIWTNATGFAFWCGSMPAWRLMRRLLYVLGVGLVAASLGFAHEQPSGTTPSASEADPGGGAKRKVFIDQDAGFATGTDIHSILVLLQSPEVEVVGIAITSGDGWAKASTQTVLRVLELTGYGHIPVAQGAQHPLINTREETLLWEAKYGEFSYKGTWLNHYIPLSPVG